MAGRPTISNYGENAVVEMIPGVTIRSGLQMFVKVVRPVKKLVGNAAAAAANAAVPGSGEAAREAGEGLFSVVVVGLAALGSYTWYHAAPAFVTPELTGQPFTGELPTPTPTPTATPSYGGGMPINMKGINEILTKFRKAVGEYHYGYIVATFLETHTCNQTSFKFIDMDAVVKIYLYLLSIKTPNLDINPYLVQLKKIQPGQIVPNPLLSNSVETVMRAVGVSNTSLLLLTNKPHSTSRSASAHRRNRTVKARRN